MKVNSCCRSRRMVRPSLRAGSATFAIPAAPGYAFGDGVWGRGAGEGKGVPAGIEW